MCRNWEERIEENQLIYSDYYKSHNNIMNTSMIARKFQKWLLLSFVGNKELVTS